MTTPTLPTGRGRHRRDKHNPQPDQVRVADLAEREQSADDDLRNPDHPTIEIELVVEDSAAARAHLEQSNQAWLAGERHVRCGGQVAHDGRVSQCPDEGIWAVRGYPRRFCAIHGVRMARLREAMHRARANADEAAAAVGGAA